MNLIIPARVRVVPKPSPNWKARPHGAQSINAITLHADASPTASATLSYITVKNPDPKKRVSYHYLLGRLGDVYQCVDDDKQAWHAGESAFRGVAYCNQYAIGVSFSNNQLGEPFDDRALAAGIRLCADLMRRYPAITIDRIHTHSAVATPAGRKHDPGPLFPLHDFIAEVARVAAATV